MGAFLKEEIDAFEILEDDLVEQNAKRKNQRVRYWVGTWNNPKMTDQEFLAHFQKLYDEELLRYCVFQREVGEKSGIEHFQFFLEFINPQYFNKLKEELIPYGAFFKPMISTAKRCQEYCSKVETRLTGPYEVGEFTSEAKRTDLIRARQMIKEGISFDEVADTFPTQCLQYERSLKSLEIEYKRKTFGESCRNIEVVYMYGPSGVKKTGRIYKKHGMSNVFVISNYEKYLFENYNFKNVVVFDEFLSQVEITLMNKLIDIYPVDVRGLGKTYPACYDKVYIVSNLPLKKQYANLNEEKRFALEPFLRRIHKVIYVDEKGVEHIEKETFFRDLKEDEIELPGLTRVIDKVVYYDRLSGKVLRIDEKTKAIQQEMELVETEEELPW